MYTNAMQKLTSLKFHEKVRHLTPLDELMLQVLPLSCWKLICPRWVLTRRRWKYGISSQRFNSRLYFEERYNLEIENHIFAANPNFIVKNHYKNLLLLHNMKYSVIKQPMPQLVIDVGKIVLDEEGNLKDIYIIDLWFCSLKRGYQKSRYGFI